MTSISYILVFKSSDIFRDSWKIGSSARH